MYGTHRNTHDVNEQTNKFSNAFRVTDIKVFFLVWFGKENFEKETKDKREKKLDSF